MYTFYRAAPAQTVTLSALAPPATGTFILSFEHRGQVANSTAVSALSLFRQVLSFSHPLDLLSSPHEHQQLM